MHKKHPQFVLSIFKTIKTSFVFIFDRELTVLGIAFLRGNFLPISSICTVFSHFLVLDKSRHVELYQFVFCQVWTSLEPTLELLLYFH